jgi:hypothetical protein
MKIKVERKMVDQSVASLPPHMVRRVQSTRMFRILSLGMILGPALFTMTWCVLGFLRPEFDIISNPVSGLGVGDYGLLMNAGFVACGLATFLGVLGVFGVIAAREAHWSRFCFILLGISAAGVAIDGLFTFRSFFPHFVGFLLAAGLPVVGFPLTGRHLRASTRERRLGAWLFASGPLLLALMALFFATFDPLKVDAGIGVAGLTERILILTLHGTFAALGWWGYTASVIAI